MIEEEELLNIIDNLVSNNFHAVAIEGMQIRLNLWHDGQILHLTTPVFYGENYIPPSVRKAVHQLGSNFSEIFKISFSIEEESCSILLNCTVDWSESIENLKQFFYEFVWLAEEWKQRLNEKGREDLLPIYIKK